jgi:hypothetical protein
MLLAPKGAVTHLHHHGRVDGVWEITWDMGGGKRKVTLQMGAGPTLIYQMWEMMDKIIDDIKDDAEDVDLLVLKGQAFVMADVLALFMRPHFIDRDSVLRESNRRWKCRKAGEPVETAGVGTLRFVPPPGTKKYGEDRSAAPPIKSRGKKKVVKTRFSDADIASIRSMTAKVSIEKVAAVFQATEDEVRAVL